MNDQTIYTGQGGTISKGLYIERPADQELFENCLKGELSFVLTARQSGKSSLMVRTIKKLRENGIQAVAVDCSLKDSLGLTEERWYQAILRVMIEELELELNITTWWQKHEDKLITERFELFFREEILKKIQTPIAIFFDEIDATFSLTFKDSFFATLRSIYNSRGLFPEFERLVFVLLGVALPSDLIRNPTMTPFNIGRRVELNDFTLEEALQFAEGLPIQPGDQNKVMQWILDWTGGHPYLTQVVCENLSTNGELVVECEQVNACIQGLFVRAGARNQNIDMVRSYFSEVEGNTPDPLLRAYGMSLENKALPEERQSLINRLILTGIVKYVGSQLGARNRVYETIFNKEWVIEQLKKIRAIAPEDFEFGIVKQAREDYIAPAPSTLLRPAAAASEPTSPTASEIDSKSVTLQQTKMLSPAEQMNSDTAQAGMLAFVTHILRNIQRSKYILLISVLAITAIMAGVIFLGAIQNKENWFLPLGALFILLLLITGLVNSVIETRLSTEEKLAAFVESKSTPKQEEKEGFLSSVTAWLSDQTGKWRLFISMSRQIAQANLTMHVWEFIAVKLLVILCGAMVGWYIAGGKTGAAWTTGWPAMLLGAIISLWISSAYLRQRRITRLAMFEKYLPDSIHLMVNGLRSGYSLLQAMEVVCREMPTPVSHEFKRIVQEVQLGLPLESALDTMGRRIPSGGLGSFITVLKIYRDVGGNLAEGLSRLLHVLTLKRSQALKLLKRRENHFKLYYLLASMMSCLQSALALNYYGGAQASPTGILLIQIPYALLSIAIFLDAIRGNIRSELTNLSDQFILREFSKEINKDLLVGVLILGVCVLLCHPGESIFWLTLMLFLGILPKL